MPLFLPRCDHLLSLPFRPALPCSYVSEMARPEKRGLYTALLQMTSLGGMLLSLSIVMILQAFISPCELLLP